MTIVQGKKDTTKSLVKQNKQNNEKTDISHL